MCDGQEGVLSKFHIDSAITTQLFCENQDFLSRSCNHCGEDIMENVTFLQNGKGGDCQHHDGDPCNRDYCNEDDCRTQCNTVELACKFVERVGCRGELIRNVAVRFGPKPTDSEVGWVWGDVEAVSSNMLHVSELQQLATVFGLCDIKTQVLQHEFAVKMRLDQAFQGVAEITAQNCPALMNPDTRYARKRERTLQELQALTKCLANIDKVCQYVHDNFARTTDDTVFKQLIRNVDADLVHGRGNCAVSPDITLRLELDTVCAVLEPGTHPSANMHPALNVPETCHRFDMWMQLREINSPIYHNHQILVDRLDPALGKRTRTISTP